MKPTKPLAALGGEGGIPEGCGEGGIPEGCEDEEYEDTMFEILINDCIDTDHFIINMHDLYNLDANKVNREFQKFFVSS